MFKRMIETYNVRKLIKMEAKFERISEPMLSDFRRFMMIQKSNGDRELKRQQLATAVGLLNTRKIKTPNVSSTVHSPKSNLCL